jgi:peptidoglycan/xylan/chitin deacetylase (PgdA/CDA1 family)
MSARYLVRFDDICPTMDWQSWSRVEQILDRAGIRPIIAVVPDNRDAKLNFGAPAHDFWLRVRKLQERGWTVGWHGHQHDYTNDLGGIVGIHRGSEFAGVSEALQRQKLTAAARIFGDNGVRPTVWVAPGHSFDSVTVRLLPEFGVDVISDGLFWRVVKTDHCTWIPQQLWRFRRIPFGVWTVCFHVNGWGGAQFSRFEADISRYRASITSVDELLGDTAASAGILDTVFQSLYRRAVIAKNRTQRAKSE